MRAACCLPSFPFSPAQFPSIFNSLSRPPNHHGNSSSSRSPVCVSNAAPLVLTEWKRFDFANRPISPFIGPSCLCVSPIEVTSTQINPYLLLERGLWELFYLQHHQPSVDSHRSRPIQVSPFRATFFVCTSLSSYKRAGPLPSHLVPRSLLPGLSQHHFVSATDTFKFSSGASL